MRHGELIHSVVCRTCTSSLYTLTYDQITVEFGCSRLIATLGLSLFVAGLGLGPMVRFSSAFLLLAPFFVRIIFTAFPLRGEFGLTIVSYIDFEPLVRSKYPFRPSSLHRTKQPLPKPPSPPLESAIQDCFHNSYHCN